MLETVEPCQESRLTLIFAARKITPGETLTLSALIPADSQDLRYWQIAVSRAVMTRVYVARPLIGTWETEPAYYDAEQRDPVWVFKLPPGAPGGRGGDRITLKVTNIGGYNVGFEAAAVPFWAPPHAEHAAQGWGEGSYCRAPCRAVITPHPDYLMHFSPALKMHYQARRLAEFQQSFTSGAPREAGTLAEEMHDAQSRDSQRWPRAVVGDLDPVGWWVKGKYTFR